MWDFTSSTHSSSIYSSCCRLHQSMYQPFMSLVHGASRLPWACLMPRRPSFVLSQIYPLWCLESDHPCAWIGPYIWSVCCSIFRKHVACIAMRLVCVPSPLLACNPCNMSWCQSFPWFMALFCCLSVTTMLLCTPSYCCYSTTCQGIAPMTPHLCAQGIAPMTPHLCAQGIATLCRALDITSEPALLLLHPHASSKLVLVPQRTMALCPWLIK